MHSLQNNLVRFTGLFFFLLTIFGMSPEANAQMGLEVETDTLTQTVLIHPVLKDWRSSEHEYKSHLHLGDQLGRDFGIGKIDEDGIVRRYKNNGKANEDWYAWKKNVMAPFDAKVSKVNEADSTNIPGVMNSDVRPGLIFFEKENGLTVVYAHVREIKVKEGDRVKAGQIVAKVGNNGNSRNPHVHVGAWKDDTPLQIQVDLYAEQRSGNNTNQSSK